MAVSNNVKFSVDNRGLSFAIDDKLDNLFQQDIKFNVNEWQSIFNLIKANQVETNYSKFTDKDKDIRNGRQYVVHAGHDYEITQDVWGKIVKMAQEKLGINTPDAETKPEDVQSLMQDAGATVVVQERETPEDAVKTILQGKIEVNDERMAEIVQKYNNIVKYNADNGIPTDNDKLAERILNYARGLQFHDQETQFAISWAGEQESNEKIENASVGEAMKNGDLDAFKDAFHQMAKEYIESYDDAEGDGKINMNEFMAMEERELGIALSPEDKQAVQEQIINRIAILDKNNDNKLDENEIAAYLWAMSKINDGATGKSAHDITFSEWKAVQESMGILSLGDDATQEDIDKYALFAQALTNGYNGLKK